MAHTELTPCQFNKWNYQVFINIKKYKMMLEIRKDHLRIILSIAIQDLCFKELTSITRINKT